MAEITCRQCGETDNLSGSPSPDGIRVTCGSCGSAWLRDDVPQRCATCGGTDVELRPRALTEYSRGTQLSIVGFGRILLCPVCDRGMFKRSEVGLPVPFHYRSAALDPEAHGSAGDDGQVLITPK